MNDRNQERLVDTIVYVLCLLQAGLRFIEGKNPFDFDDPHVVEYLTNKCLMFVEDPDTSLEKAHQAYVTQMINTGWELGAEDFQHKIVSDLLEYKDLDKEERRLYSFLGGLVASIKEFLNDLINDLESQVKNNLSNVSRLKVIRTYRQRRIS